MVKVSIDYDCSGLFIGFVLRDFSNTSNDIVPKLVNYLDKKGDRATYHRFFTFDEKEFDVTFSLDKENHVQAYVRPRSNVDTSPAFLLKLHKAVENVLHDALRPYLDTLDRINCLREAGLLDVK